MGRLRHACVEGASRVRSEKPMPYRCRDCQTCVSLKTGTVVEDTSFYYGCGG